MTTQRRSFIKIATASGFGAALSAWNLSAAAANMSADPFGKSNGRRVVVVGGGFGGTITAKYIRLLDTSIDVVLIEPNRQLVSAPFSNQYLGGLLPDLSTLTRGYDKLVAQHGIQMVYDSVSSSDTDKNSLIVGGKTISYDRLVLSPGIDFWTEDLKGYDLATTPAVMPHAWKTGAQTRLLRQQLEAMPDGGTILMTVPLAPFRCHAAPYERASLIALYLKQNKPKSKIVLLDANANILVNPELFKNGWKKHYEGLIDYRSGQKLTSVNASQRSVILAGGQEIKGDVVNLIPPQRAGQIAVATGLVGPDKAWCPVNAQTFESTLKKNIHVIGDACNAGVMPKTAFSANAQAKVCAHNLVALLNGKELSAMSGIDTAFSYLSAKEAASQVAVFTANNGKIIEVPNAGGASADWSETEAAYAASWLNNILTEMTS